MERLRKLISEIGGHPRLLAIVLGAGAACGFQPLRLWPLTLIAVALLIELAARARRARDAALVGWLFGVGHFTLGNNWIATAFTYQANMPQWLGWIAVFLLSLYLAVFPMLSVLGAWLFARRFAVRDGAAPLPWLGLALVPFWIVGEWLRSWVFTGFAWNPLGIVLLGGFDGQGLAFLAPWLGTYGLSGLAVALAAFARSFARSLPACDPGGPRAPAGYYAPLALIAGGGMIAPASHIAPPQGSIAFTLVQPDVRQEFLDDPRLYESNFARTARLSLPRRPGQQRVVFWPESVLPDYLRDGYPEEEYLRTTYAADPAMARARLAQVIGPRALLLTGAAGRVVENGQGTASRNAITCARRRLFSFSSSWALCGD